MMVAEYYDSPVQAFEPFIWTFGDASSILLCSLLLILLFMDLPKLSPFTPYMLLRMPHQEQGGQNHHGSNRTDPEQEPTS